MNTTPNMPINSKPIGLSAEGLHVARCYALVQLGTIYIPDKWQSRVRISWELPNDQRVFVKGHKPAPKTVSKEYASNLYGNSWLKKHLISWFGQEVMNRLDETNNEGFDPFIVVGQPCLLSIVHLRSGKGAWYEDIDGVFPLRHGDVCPAQYNPTKVLTMENFSFEIFNSLPEFVQKKIMGSKEWKLVNGGYQKPPINNSDVRSSGLDQYRDDEGDVKF
jgi:hypothetical protein